MPDPREWTVEHEIDAHRFAIYDGDGVAYLDYQALTDKVVFTHTEVPVGFEGMGLGSRLARAGLDWARSKGLRVIPVCPFVAAYIRRHPEDLDLTRRRS